jgi:hypothetical protein
MDDKQLKEQESQTENKKNEDDFFEHELIIKALDRLSKLVKKEEEFIENKQYEKAVELIPDKIELVNFFAKNKDKILGNFNLSKEEDVQKREEMKNLVQNLLDTSSKNMNKIKKAQYLSSKIMEILKESVQKSEVKNKNYSNSGKSVVKNRINKHVMLSKEA